MRKKLLAALVAVGSIGLFVGSDAFAEQSRILSGRVSAADGEGLAGAMVRLQNPKTEVAETVYTDAQGEYRLRTTLSGALTLRVRLPYFRDAAAKVALKDGAVLRRDFTLAKMSDPQMISDSLPALYHLGEIAFDKDPASVLSRAQFQRDCVTCHQFGNELTRQPRSAEDWAPTIARMHSYLYNFDKKTIAKRATMLAEAFQGEPIGVRPIFPVASELANAKIYEFPLEGALFPHDADISAVDGLAYSVDRHADTMLITDLATGATETIDQPPTQREADPNANGYTARSNKPGPHSLALGKDNLWYTTNATGDTIGVFDASAKTWKASYLLPDAARYPHTIRIAKDNVVWFTLAASDHVGRVDPATGKIDLVKLPAGKPIGIAAGTSPYGIAISPVDGSVWYARLFGDTIGYVDPKTLEVTEHKSPVRGPRRLRFDADGTLWLAGFTDGEIARIDPKTMDAMIIPMPEYAKGYYPLPYALAVHPQTQEVWVAETATDRIYRYLPKQERFIAYPMPLRGTYTRDFAFTEEGWACTANSPIINASLEDGVSGLICVDVDGAEQTK